MYVEKGEGEGSFASGEAWWGGGSGEAGRKGVWQGRSRCCGHMGRSRTPWDRVEGPPTRRWTPRNRGRNSAPSSTGITQEMTQSRVWQPGGCREPGQVAYTQGLMPGCRRPGLGGRSPKEEMGPTLLSVAKKGNRREGVRRGNGGGVREERACL